MFITLPSRIFALAAALAVVLAPAASAKEAIVGPVSLQVPDDFKLVSGPAPAIHQASSGITIQVTELPPEALHEFQGQTFLDYLQSLGFTNPTYVKEALKRSDPHTFVMADAKGAEGPEKRFLLVIGGTGRAAIISASTLESDLASGRATRASIETILDSAAVLTTPAAKP